MKRKLNEEISIRSNPINQKTRWVYYHFHMYIKYILFLFANKFLFDNFEARKTENK